MRARRLLRLGVSLAVTGVLLGAAPALSAPATAADPSGPCALPGGFLSEGTTNWANFPRPVGTVRAAMLFVDFANAPATTTVDQEYNLFLPSSRDWYSASSYGRFSLEVVPHRRWLRLSSGLEAAARTDRTMTEGGPPTVVRDNPALASVIGNAVAAADPAFDFSKIDIVFVVPSRNSGYTRSYATFEQIRADGRTIRTESVLASDRYSWGAKLLNHEGGHTISLPDLYGGPGGHGYIGGWDLQGLISGPAPDYFAWHKWKLGWLDTPQLTCLSTPGTVDRVLTPVETAGGHKAIVVKYSSTRVYVAEVRQRSGLDSKACDKGVLVYRVDSAVSSGSGPVRVMDSHPGTSVCGNGLNDATYDLGAGEVSTFTDSAAKVQIQVLSANGNDYTVRATKG